MNNLHQTPRESSSELGRSLAAKTIDDILDMFYESEVGSPEAQEAMDELIRRAALYTELKAEVAELKDKLKTRTVVVAPDSPRGQ